MKRKLVWSILIVIQIVLIIDLYNLPIRAEWLPNNFVPLKEAIGQRDLVARDNLVYYIYGNILVILDVSNPDDISILGKYYSDANLVDIALYKDFAFLASIGNGLQIVNIGDPNNPTLVAESPAKEKRRIAEILVEGNIAILYDTTNVNGGPFVLGTKTIFLDITDPNNIRELASLDAIGRPLVINGNFLYTSGERHEDGYRDRWLNIIDISDIENPILISSFSTFGGVIDAAIQNNYLFISSNQGLYVVDISNPIEPVEVGRSEISSFETIPDGNFLYYRYLGFVGVIDISNPSKPVRIARNDDVNASGLSISNGNVLFAQTIGGGLYVFKSWEN